jgi:hypothetical protein
MSKKSVLVEDSRIPGGSVEEIKEVYNIEVEFLEDGTFKVSGDAKDVDDYINDYCIIVSE